MISLNKVCLCVYVCVCVCACGGGGVRVGCLSGRKNVVKFIGEIMFMLQKHQGGTMSALQKHGDYVYLGSVRQGEGVVLHSHKFSKAK